MSIKKYYSDSLWFEITVTGYADVDPVWANWAGAWAILDSAGVTVLSGAMVLDAVGVMYARISSALMAASTTAGIYSLIVQVSNSVAGYSQELPHEKLTILPQGII